jgi:hypothetical protein
MFFHVKHTFETQSNAGWNAMPNNLLSPYVRVVLSILKYSSQMSMVNKSDGLN